MKIDKNAILEACIAKQNELIDGFTTKLNAMEAEPILLTITFPLVNP